MDDKLKACPFCGGGAYVASSVDEGGWRSTIACRACAAEASAFDMDDAVGLWNRRVVPPEAVAEVDRLRTILGNLLAATGLRVMIVMDSQFADGYITLNRDGRSELRPYRLLGRSEDGYNLVIDPDSLPKP